MTVFRHIASAAVAATALTLVLTGCADKTPTGSGTGGGGGGEAVAWAENVCKAIEDDLTNLRTAPDINMSNPQQAKDGMVAYLGDLSLAVGNMASGIKDAGKPPVADGVQAVDEMTKILDEVKASIDEARANLEKASVSDPAAFQAAFQKVSQDLSKVADIEDPTQSLKASKELDEAFDKAPTCKKLDSGDSEPASPAPSS